MDAKQQERRKTTRFPSAQTILLKTANGNLLARARDVSVGGVFVFGPTAVPVGSEVQMTFTVPTQDVFREEVTFRCEGKVIRIEPQDSGEFGMAVTCRPLQLAEVASGERL